MIEREPDFEDQKIRAWTFGEDHREDQQFEGDPTMLSLNMEKEEIFESRAYRFQTSPEASLYLLNLVTSRQHHLALSLEESVQAATELMEGITFKFLAKRTKEDGLITSLLVAVRGDDRCLLSRQEWVKEAEYRQAVQEFEAGFLPKGVLGPPMVVTPEEWHRYAQEGPFAEN